MAKLAFNLACAQYVHRFTMEHVPQWAKLPLRGRYYAPQFRTDAEWYANTIFPPDPGCYNDTDCHTSGMTWPLGQWLSFPYSSRVASVDSEGVPRDRNGMALLDYQL